MGFMKKISKNKISNKTYTKKVGISDYIEDVTFIFDKHKSIRLSLSKKGNIIVKMPSWCNESQAESFIQKKTLWILKKKKDFEKIIQNQDNIWFYLGNPFKISLKEGKRHIALGKNFLYIYLPKKKLPEKKLENPENSTLLENSFPENSHSLERALKAWEKKLAENILAKRFARMWQEFSEYGSPFYGLAPPSLKVRALSSRFGSCTSKSEITLAVRLIYYPLIYIDYIIIHELCHLKIMSHDKRFYTLMEQCLPEAKSYKKNFRKWRILHGNI